MAPTIDGMVTIPGVWHRVAGTRAGPVVRLFSKPPNTVDFRILMGCGGTQHVTPKVTFFVRRARLENSDHHHIFTRCIL